MSSLVRWLQVSYCTAVAAAVCILAWPSSSSAQMKFRSGMPSRQPTPALTPLPSIGVNGQNGNIQGQIVGTQIQGQILGQITGQIQGQVLGQIQGQILGQITGQIVGLQIQGQILGQIQGQVLGQITGQIVGQITGQIVGLQIQGLQIVGSVQIQGGLGAKGALIGLNGLTGL